MQNAYIIGLGKSGVAAARLLRQDGWTVHVSDRGQSENLQLLQQELATENIEVHLGHTFEPDPTEMQRIVVSPGVSWDLPALTKARELGIDTMVLSPLCKTVSIHPIFKILPDVPSPNSTRSPT